MDKREQKNAKDTPGNLSRDEVQAFIKFAREKIISHQVGPQISSKSMP